MFNIIYQSYGKRQVMYGIRRKDLNAITNELMSFGFSIIEIVKA